MSVGIWGPRVGFVTSVLHLRRGDSSNALILGGNDTEQQIFLICIFFLYFVLNPETISKAKTTRIRLIRLLSKCASRLNEKEKKKRMVVPVYSQNDRCF